jgi:hypothetical protein
MFIAIALPDLSGWYSTGNHFFIGDVPSPAKPAIAVQINPPTGLC